MILSDVMDEIGQALDTIDGLRVHPYNAASITPPAAIVQWPSTFTYDTTYGRGADTQTFPVMIAVGKYSDRTSADTLSKYANGSGASSVKEAIESFEYTALDSIRVESVEFGTVTISAIEYLVGIFQVEVIGTGA